MDRNIEAVNIFDKNASAYDERYANLNLYNDTYDLFCSLLPKRHSTILDVGCGPGNITDYLLRKRPDFQITGIDLAPKMLEIALEKNPSAKFEMMDCRELDKLKTKFDAIICGFAIPYLSVDETSKLIADCANLLEPGGIFYFSLIEGKYEESDYQYASNQVDKSFVYYYSPVKIMSMLSKHELKIVQVEDIPWINVQGKKETHLIFICTTIAS